MPAANRASGRESEALRLVIEAVQDYAIFMLSPKGHVRTWNLGAERIKGYRPAEIIGQHFSIFYTQEDRDAGRPTHLLSVAQEHGRVEDEGWRLRKDGTRFWADVVITAVYDRTGTLIGYAKVTRDLTERRAAESQRRALAVEQEARAAAETALQARDRFLSIAAHELKTPLAGTQLVVDSLLRAERTGQLDAERLEAGLGRLTAATERLAGLVNELLDVSRLTSADPVLRRERADLASIAQEVVARFSDLDGTGRVVLEAPDDLWLEVDRSRIDQVIANLVDNALKYSSLDQQVDVRLRKEGRGAEILVSDRGIGLGAELADRLFTAFSRGSNAQHVHGLGLGLHIAQQIVAMHGGRISGVPRKDGPGSAFRVWLPDRLALANETAAS